MTYTTTSTDELLAVLAQAKRDGHHARTLARGKTNAAWTVTIDAPVQPGLPFDSTNVVNRTTDNT